MPKRVGYLYERMLDRDLIRQTILEGTRGKRRRRDVQRVLAEALAQAEALGQEERRVTEEAAEAYRRCLGERTNGSA